MEIFGFSGVYGSHNRISDIETTSYQWLQTLHFFHYFDFRCESVRFRTSSSSFGLCL